MPPKLGPGRFIDGIYWTEVTASKERRGLGHNYFSLGSSANAEDYVWYDPFLWALVDGNIAHIFASIVRTHDPDLPDRFNFVDGSQCGSMDLKLVQPQYCAWGFSVLSDWYIDGWSANCGDHCRKCGVLKYLLPVCYWNALVYRRRVLLLCTNMWIH